MSDHFDISTIIFALLAVFVLFKLRSVLGTRNGNERPPFDPLGSSKQHNGEAKLHDGTNKAVKLPGSISRHSTTDSNSPTGVQWEKYANVNARQALNEIQATDRTFDVQNFLGGAKSAYEMIVSAFAAGDKKTLNDLLGREVFDGFESVINARESRKEKIETTFVSIENAFIEDAQLRNNTAQITVRFVSKLITATKDIENNVIDGNPDKIVDITDVWTFSRDSSLGDPNWKLIATETDRS